MLSGVEQLGFMKFICPDSFSAPELFASYGESVNIYDIFRNYLFLQNPNAKYIYSMNSFNTLTLTASASRTFYWGYSLSGVDYTFNHTSGTITPFSTGMTKRFVIVNDTASLTDVVLPTGARWVFLGRKINSISATQYNSSVAYIHCTDSGLSLTSILANAFTGSTLVGVINIPYSVTSIGDSAFCQSGGSSIIIPSSVTTIVNNPFYNSTITSFVVNGTNFIVENGVLYNYTKTRLIHGIKGTSGPLTIPSTVTLIGQFAFYGITTLTGSLVIPSNVTTIHGSAFLQCTGFTGDLIIPSTVTSFGWDVFQSCTGFTGALTIGRTNFSAGGSTGFLGCSNFTALNLPVGYNGQMTWNFSSKFSGASLDQSVKNILSGTKTLTIGATNKASLLAYNSNAVTDAAARGITIN